MAAALLYWYINTADVTSCAVEMLYSASGLLSEVEGCLTCKLCSTFQLNCSRIPNIKLKFIELAPSLSKPPLKVSGNPKG